MDIVADQKQITAKERAQINRQVKSELVEHLYQGCLPGTISGIPVGIAIFIDFYGHTNNNLLFGWYVLYNSALVALTSLYFIYRRYRYEFDLETWLYAYAGVMSLCALTWGVSVFLIPDNIMRQYFAFIALFLIATGYATGSIGVFELCLVTLTLIVVPLVTWCFLKGTLFYNLVGFFALIYIGFMAGINRRSTQWFKDSLKLKYENSLVSYQANHDLLTDLPNQRLLPQYVESAINTVKDSNNIFALVSFSLNRMEMISDSLGHHAVNEIIQSVAARLNVLVEEARSADTQYIVTISRKDTFYILIVPLMLSQVESKIKQLFTVLDELFYLESRGIKVTASLGVSFYPQDGTDTETLMANANTALLKAKQFGGNRVEYYRAEISKPTSKQLELESDLHNALKNNQLLLHYQPLVNIRSGKIEGMEALLRWQHPVHGFISPMHFIPLAEETGLIIPIGEWVIREACRQTQVWHQMGFSSLRIAINLSEKQLRDETILDTVANILSVSQFDPRHVELEITETSILEEKVIPIIKEFKNMGLSLAVDDFGTGYSGLSYLKRFSIDKLKIDQSFIRDIPGSNDSITIVSAIIAMAKELHVTTLAEGVETKDQLGFLTEKGCDYVQGYYFSKPLETEFFTQLLLSHRTLADVPA